MTDSFHFAACCPKCGGELLTDGYRAKVDAPDQSHHDARCDHERGFGRVDWGPKSNSGPGAVGAAPDRGQHLVGGAVMADRTCSVEGCDRPPHARGWCTMHYARWAKHGDPLVVGRRARADRTLSGIRSRTLVDEVGCWVWQGYRTAHGYGRIGADYAHRLTYELVVGPIPDGLQLDHLCRNRGCCNPAHLEPVTMAENIRRGYGHGSETHCPQGHPYDEANTYRPKRGGRMCRTCKRNRDRAGRSR